MIVHWDRIEIGKERNFFKHLPLGKLFHCNSFVALSLLNNSTVGGPDNVTLCSRLDIASDPQSSFDNCSSGVRVDCFDLPYDLYSIMHFGAFRWVNFSEEMRIHAYIFPPFRFPRGASMMMPTMTTRNGSAQLGNLNHF